MVWALLGGAVWALCFQPEPRLALPWVALGPLLLLAGAGCGDGRDLKLSLLAGFGLGWLHGLAAWGLEVPWIASTVGTYSQASPALARLALLLLALYLGLYNGLFVLLGRLLSRRAWGVWLGLPALWVSLEWLRAYLLTGFPWNLAAYSWIDVPGALGLTAWTGSYGLSFLVVIANVSVVRAVIARSLRPLVVLLVIAVALVVSRWQEPSLSGSPAGLHTSSAEGHAIRIVQPNTNILLEPDDQAIAESYRRLFRLSDCQEGELVVWPESAAWPYAYYRDPLLQRDIATLVQQGCNLLFNSSSREGDLFFNSALLVGPNGVEARYDKNQLVPFGEYMPLGDLFPFLRQVARLEGEFSRGRELTLLQWQGELLGIAVCFEIIFPDQVAARARAGATVLVTLTNDAWYGDTSAPWQHFAAARFRAAENRRPVIRAAITGISALIDPYGRVIERLGVGEEGVLATSIEGWQRLTPYSRAPMLLPGVCSLGVLLALFPFVWRVDRDSN